MKSREEISVYEVNKPMSMDYPVVSPDYVVCINHGGTVDGYYDARKAQFNPHDIAIMYPNHMFVASSASSDYHATHIVVPQSIYVVLLNHFVHNGRFLFDEDPDFSLTQEQYADLMTLVESLKTILRSDSPKRIELQITMMEIIIETIYFYHSKNGVEPPQAKQRLSHRFYDAIIQNCTSHHDVAFYADLFCLSPKYFGEVIKRETGHNAHYWLSFYIVAKAKQMLLMNPDAQLMQVAEELGFRDLSSFSRFFKTATGLSPTEWRYAPVADVDME